MTNQLEPGERRWLEYRRWDGKVIRRAMPRPHSRLSPRAVATIRASHLDAGLLAILFDISDDMAKSIRWRRRLAKLGRNCKPISDRALMRMALDVIRTDTVRMLREALSES